MIQLTSIDTHTHTHTRLCLLLTSSKQEQPLESEQLTGSHSGSFDEVVTNNYEPDMLQLQAEYVVHTYYNMYTLRILF